MSHTIGPAIARGPKNINILFSTEKIINDFPDFQIIQLTEEIAELSKGNYLKGGSAVVRFVGRKVNR